MKKTLKIDLGEISQLDAGLYWYRVSGTTTSLLSVIKDVCEAASADFMVQLVGGDPDPVTGVCTTPPTIKIRVMPRQSSPTLGVLTSYINQAESSGILVNKLPDRYSSLSINKSPKLGKISCYI